MVKQRKGQSEDATEPQVKETTAVSEVSGYVDRGFSRVSRLLKLSLPPYSDSHVWEKDDVSSILHWLKQFLGIFLGILFGVIPITGWTGLALAAGTIYSACSSFIAAAKVPDTLYSPTEAAQEALMATFMTFLLFWTLTYTIVHPVF